MCNVLNSSIIHLNWKLYKMTTVFQAKYKKNIFLNSFAHSAKLHIHYIAIWSAKQYSEYTCFGEVMFSILFSKILNKRSSFPKHLC